MLSCKICEISKNAFFCRTPPVATCGNTHSTLLTPVIYLELIGKISFTSICFHNFFNVFISTDEDDSGAVMSDTLSFLEKQNILSSSFY